MSVVSYNLAATLLLAACALAACNVERVAADAEAPDIGQDDGGAAPADAGDDTDDVQPEQDVMPVDAASDGIGDDVVEAGRDVPVDDTNPEDTGDVDADADEVDADAGGGDADVGDVDADTGDIDDGCSPGPANACGGCAALEVVPGDPCACGSGVWACNADQPDEPWCTSDGRPIYPDLDEDSHGADAAFPPPEACDGPVPFAFEPTDCDDDDPDVVPGAYDRTCPDDPAARLVCGPGAEWTTEPCATGQCVEGLCETACDPGAERRCVGPDDEGTWTVEQCDARGLGFELFETCEAGANCLDGTCWPEDCDNRVDDDGDGAIDCDDDSCADDPWCEPLSPDLAAAVIGVDGLRYRLSLRWLDGTAVEISERLAGPIPQFPSWLPGTSELMFTTWSDELDSPVLRILDVTSGTVTDIPTSDLDCPYIAWPGVSPDGSTLAFECVTSDQMRMLEWPSLELLYAADGAIAPEWGYGEEGAIGVVAIDDPFSEIRVSFFPRLSPSMPVALGYLRSYEVRPLPGSDGGMLDRASFELLEQDSPMDTAFDIAPNTVLVGRLVPAGSRSLVLVRRNGDEQILDHGTFVPAFAALTRIAPGALSEELSE